MTAVLCVRDGDTVYLACDSRVVCGDYYFDTADKVRKYQIGDKRFYLGMAGHDPTIARIDAILDHPEDFDYDTETLHTETARDVARYVSDVMEEACQKKSKHGVDAILVVGGEGGPEVYLLGTDGSMSGPVTTPVAIGSGGAAAQAAWRASSDYSMESRVRGAIYCAAEVCTEVGGLARSVTITAEDL